MPVQTTSNANKAIYVSYKGVTYKVQSPAQSSACEMQNSANTFNTVQDANGNAHVTKSVDKSGTVTINVLEGSNDDKKFNLIFKDQGQEVDNGNQVPDLRIAYNAGTNGKVSVASGCAIQKQANVTYNQTQGNAAYSLTAEFVDTDFEGTTEDLKAFLAE